MTALTVTAAMTVMTVTAAMAATVTMATTRTTKQFQQESLAHATSKASLTTAYTMLSMNHAPTRPSSRSSGESLSLTAKSAAAEVLVARMGLRVARYPGKQTNNGRLVKVVRQQSLRLHRLSLTLVISAFAYDTHPSTAGQEPAACFASPEKLSGLQGMLDSCRDHFWPMAVKPALPRSVITLKVQFGWTLLRMMLSKELHNLLLCCAVLWLPLSSWQHVGRRRGKAM